MSNYPSDLISTFIGIKIKERRQELGIRQIELSQKLNISRASISNIEGGRQLIQINTLYDISKILDVDVTYFLPYINNINNINNNVLYSDKDFKNKDYLDALIEEL